MCGNFLFGVIMGCGEGGGGGKTSCHFQWCHAESRLLIAGTKKKKDRLARKNDLCMPTHARRVRPIEPEATRERVTGYLKKTGKKTYAYKHMHVRWN